MDQIDTELSRDERLQLALRQGALVLAVIVVQWLVARRVRPVDMVDRDIVSAPFQWSAVVWICVLARSAWSHRGDPIRAAEGIPMIFGLGAGVVSFAIGLVSSNPIPLGDRLNFLVVHALGVSVFWWAIATAASLLVAFVRNR